MFAVRVYLIAQIVAVLILGATVRPFTLRRASIFVMLMIPINLIVAVISLSLDLIDSNMLSMSMIISGGVMGLFVFGYGISRAFSRQPSEISHWTFRGAPQAITAVAKAAVSEGIRTKIALWFALMVLASIPFFWSVAEGDGTLRGRVQMFTVYSFGFSGFALGLLTIFFSCRSLSHEIVSRQIYGVVSKPVPRWQILAGKWLGVMFLNVVVLAIVGVGTYVGTIGLIRQFRGQLEEELVTFGGLTPEASADAVAALDHVRGIGKEGPEGPIAHAMAKATGLSLQQTDEVFLKLPEETRMNLRRHDELRRRLLVARAAVKVPIPRDKIREAADRRFEHLAKEGRLSDAMSDQQIREQLRQDIFGEFCTVRSGENRTWKLQGPRPEKRSDFIMSIRFKIHVAADLPAYRHPITGEVFERDTLYCVWGIGDPSTAKYAEYVSPQPVRTFQELEIPTECIGEDGSILVTFINIDPRRQDVVFDFPDALLVLYRVGSFEFNLFQTSLAVLVPLICLASFGIFASTFLSFPVGSLILVSLYLVSLSMGFVSESLAVTDEYAPREAGLSFELRRLIVESIQAMLSLGDLEPTNQLIEGRSIDWTIRGFRDAPWSAVLGQWPFVFAKSAIVMMMAVSVFRRRELAAVVV